MKTANTLIACDIDFCYSHDLNYLVSVEYIFGRKTIMIAFPGTKDIEDLKTIKNGTYHLDVQKMWKGIKADILDLVTDLEPCDYLIGGHSLGGVLAELVANRIADIKYALVFNPSRVRVVTFGAPKHRYKQFFSTTRFVLPGDIIPFLPFKFKQAEAPYTILGKRHALVKPLTFLDFLVTLLKRGFIKAHSMDAYIKALGATYE